MSNNNGIFSRFSAWFTRLDPVMRKRAVLFGGAGAFMLLSFLIITTTSNDTPINFNKPKKIDYTLFSGHKPREVTLDVLGGQIDKVKENFNEMRATLARQEEKLKLINEQIAARDAELNKRTDQLNEKNNDLAKQLKDAGARPPLPRPAMPYPAAPEQIPGTTPPIPGSTVDSQGNAVPQGPKIRIVTADNGASGAAGKVAGKGKITEIANIRTSGRKGSTLFLPAGAILSGTLITGLDAPTSNQTRQEPFPVLLRIKHDAILPNRYRLDVRECFLIGSGYGDLSSERAYLRSERMSCVKKDGTVLESAIDAYSVGEDGKAGVRGRVVSKNGQLIGNALLSGAIAGLSQAFAPQNVQSLNTNVLPGQRQVYQYPSAQYVGGQAFAGSVKGASAQIAQYYLEMAKNIMPVIEVDAGRKIDFVLIRGLAVKPRSVDSMEAGANANKTASSVIGAGQDVLASMLRGGGRQGGNGLPRHFGNRNARQDDDGMTSIDNSGEDFDVGGELYGLSGLAGN